jgi:predicted esterase
MPDPTESILLLHGIGRTRLSMRPLERTFAAVGYRTKT